MPNDPRVFVLAGVMAGKSGNIPGVFDALQRAVTLAPDSGPGLRDWPSPQARQNQFDKAIATAEKVAQVSCSNLRAWPVRSIAHRAGHLTWPCATCAGA